MARPGGNDLCLGTQRVRSIAKAFRRAASPADALFAFDNAIRLGRTSLAIFRRLNTPFAFQREVRELERLLEREQRALVALRDALRAGKRAPSPGMHRRSRGRRGASASASPTSAFAVACYLHPGRRAKARPALSRRGGGAGRPLAES